MNASSILRAEAYLEQTGQAKLLAHMRQQPESGRIKLAADILRLDWQVMEQLLQNKQADKAEQAELGPVHTYVWADDKKKETQVGEALIKAGKLAAFTVAGGQGSRLGYEGPKGCLGVTPVRMAPLFQVFAEKLRAAERRYQVEIPWVLMTSPQNDTQTKDFLARHGYFGLRAEQVRFFVQGVMPAVEAKTGEFLLESAENLALSPDGHGGSLKGLGYSGTLKWLQERGVEILSYFQVDNPLVKVVDPAFVGAHRLSGSEFSSKATPKKYAGEKVGVFGMRAGVLGVIEYSDLPQAMAEARDESGNLRYRWGNAAIHLLNIDFIDRVDEKAALPYHRALKKVPYWEAGQRVDPQTPNAVKFEQFIFDAIALAQSPIVLGITPSDEFSPVKNATGNDSPETCRKDQLKLWARWCEAAGMSLPKDPEGVPTINFEITPLFADTQEAFLRRAHAGELPARLAEGMVL